jgi:hypothetical protein
MQRYPNDTCIPISRGLDFIHVPQIASHPVNFERFTTGGLSPWLSSDDSFLQPKGSF